MTKKLFQLVLLFLFGSVCFAQYSANTSLTPVPYPGTIPCPGSSCSPGALTGANTIITPSDFGNPMTRVTDNSTYSSADSFTSSYNGAAQINPFDSTSTRFYVFDSGNAGYPFQWNPSTAQATKLYGQSYQLNIFSDAYFSYTQPYVFYALQINGSNDPAIYSYSLASTVTPPTPTQIVDLATCAPAVAGLGYLFASNIYVSKDDQTFAIALSTTSGQGSVGAVYVVVWNRTNGCRLLNTATGAATGAWGTTGTISDSSTYSIHNISMSLDGSYVALVQACCYNSTTNKYDNMVGGVDSGIPSTSPQWAIYWWQVSTLTVTPLTTNDNCGHTTPGYSHSVNQCQYSYSYGYYGWWERPLSNPNIGPPATLVNPSNATLSLGIGIDDHVSWNPDTSGDTVPFCSSTTNGQFTPTQTYENEIICLAPTGNANAGTVWRFAHQYNTAKSSSFEAAQAVGTVSQDGKWFIWTSDWDGMLGNTSGASNTCTIGTNCRNDVFIMALPQTGASYTLTVSTGVYMGPGITVK